METQHIYKPSFPSILAFFTTFGIGSLLKDYYFHHVNFSLWIFLVVSGLGIIWFAVAFPTLILKTDGIYLRYLYSLKPKIFQYYDDIKAMNFNNNPANPKLEIVGKDNHSTNIPLNLYAKKSEFLGNLGNYKTIEFAPLVKNELTDEQLKQSSRNIIQMSIAMVVILILAIIIMVNRY